MSPFCRLFCRGKNKEKHFVNFICGKTAPWHFRTFIVCHVTAKLMPKNTSVLQLQIDFSLFKPSTFFRNVAFARKFLHNTGHRN